MLDFSLGSDSGPLTRAIACIVRTSVPRCPPAHASLGVAQRSSIPLQDVTKIHPTFPRCPTSTPRNYPHPLRRGRTLLRGCGGFPPRAFPLTSDLIALLLGECRATFPPRPLGPLCGDGAGAAEFILRPRLWDLTNRFRRT
mmetsp:Transcript_48040/g.65148  ORF Transcript_48040/g.65148 Transcript_48040/m.65148 type:complete len:141 (+) Transcript_48040:164-586(+)|eukprot:scaffold100470_cov31-Tisochrysis_lutea.AAC.3